MVRSIMENGNWRKAVIAGQSVLIIFLFGFITNFFLSDRANIHRLLEEQAEMIKCNEKVDSERSMELSSKVAIQFHELRSTMERQLLQTERLVDTICWIATTQYSDRMKSIRTNPRVLKIPNPEDKLK